MTIVAFCKPIRKCGTRSEGQPDGLYASVEYGNCAMPGSKSVPGTRKNQQLQLCYIKPWERQVTLSISFPESVRRWTF